MDKWLIKSSNNAASSSTSSSTFTSDSSIAVNDEVILDSDTEGTEDQSHNFNSSNLENKNKRQKLNKAKRLNKFSPLWLDVPEFKNWLIKHKREKNGHELAFCKVCNKEITAHRNDITRHSLSERHKLHWTQASTSHKLVDVFRTPLEDSVRRAELKLCGLLATNNLPFLLMDTLSPLCANIFPDSEIAKKNSVRRTKATAMVKDALGKEFRNQLFKVLQQPGCFFSLIMDESTDKSAIKQCAFTVIYFCNEQSRVKTRFLDMVEIASSSAIDLYNCLKNCIVSKNIPFDNLVGFAADTTNVMVGEYNSIFSNLKKELPEIVCIKCSCHMIHLAASKACLKLPRSVEDLLRNIGSHFSRSYSRQEKFKEFQIFFKVEIHKILSPAITRWLSLKACVDRVLEQYDSLKAYLDVVVFEDPSKTTEEMCSTMNNKFTKIYLEFMSYSLELLTDFNVLFQGTKPLLHKLKPETERLLKTICSNFIQMDHVRGANIFDLDHTDADKFVRIGDIYLGVSATESIQNLKSQNLLNVELERFQVTCLNFYIQLATEIKNRFDFTDPIFQLMQVVDPRYAQAFELKSLNAILKRFPSMQQYVKRQDLDNEWREHALLTYSHYGLDVAAADDAEHYWAKVFLIKNAAGVLLFKNLEKIIKLLLVLPFSNASVERVFSGLQNIKTDQRNQLSTANITALLSTKEGITENGGCLSFNPPQEMLNADIWIKK